MKHKVLIMRCDDYDPQKIAGIVIEGMEALGIKPSGRILLKPNTVIAHPEVFPYAFTRKEFLDGVIASGLMLLAFGRVLDFLFVVRHRISR